jgi:hypothetical protein
MPEFQQRASSKAQAKIPSLHFQQGAFVFNCLPSLPKPNTAQHIEQSRKQSEKKAKRNPKQSKKLSSYRFWQGCKTNPAKFMPYFQHHKLAQ